MDLTDDHLLSKDSGVAERRRAADDATICDVTHAADGALLTMNGGDTARLDLAAQHVLIAQVAHIVETSVLLDSALSQVMPLIRAVLGWDVALAWRVDPADGGLHWLYGTAEPSSGSIDFVDTSRLLVLRQGIELAGQAWDARTTVWSTVISGGGARMRALSAARARLRCGVAVPLISRGCVLGVLEFYACKARDEEPLTVRTLAVLASVLAQFMDRLEAQVMARVSTTRLAHVIDHALVVVWEVDTSGLITCCAGQGLSVLGLTPGDHAGRSIKDIFGEPSAMLTAVRRALQGEAASVLVAAANDPFRVYWMPLVDSADVIQGALGVATVEAEQRPAETLLRQCEEFFRALTQDSSDVVTVVDWRGRVLYASPSYLPILGYDPESLIGRGDLVVCVHPDDVLRARMAWQAVCAAPQQRETTHIRMRHADGGWRWLEVHYANYLDSPAIGGVVCNARDVTDPVNAHEELLSRPSACR